MTKTLKGFLEEASGILKVRNPDEQKFIDKQQVQRTNDRNGNDDDVFGGPKQKKVKAVERRKERHGYNAGEDATVYETLKGNQHKIDANKNGKIDAHDFKLLRKGEDDDVPFDPPYRKAGQVRKDRYGNVIKNVARHLARKGMKANEEVEDLEEGKPTLSAAMNRAETSRQRAIKRAARDVKRGSSIEDAIKTHDLFSKDAEKIKAHLTKEEVDDDGWYTHSQMHGRVRSEKHPKAISSAEWKSGIRWHHGKNKRININIKEESKINEVGDELTEGMMKLSKVHIVHHHDHPAAKEFAKHYTAGMKGDHREGGPTEADDKAADTFHSRYTGVRTREGFAGSGTHVYTDHKTGAKWKVDRHPNGKTFYGTDHIISHHTGPIHESFGLEEVEDLDEAIKIGSKVTVHAPGKSYHGISGRIGEIRHGLQKSDKQYTVDYDHKPSTDGPGYKSITVPKKHIKLVKEETELVDEKINMKKASMGDVVKDFQKSDAPQFKGKSQTKRREMAIAAKLSAERGGKKLGEESEQVDEADYSAKAARAGKDIGKPGKQFSKIAAKAAEKYGSAERGRKVAGAVLAKLRKEDRLVELLSDVSESNRNLMLDVFSKLNEDNQYKFIAACATEEGIDEMLNFSIMNRGK